MMKRRVVEVSSEYTETLTVPFNLRSPAAVAEACKDIIKDKVVCDVGCGEGDILWLMKKYAKRVIGFERNPARYLHAKAKGIEVVVGTYPYDPLPDADMYYMWPDVPTHIVEVIRLVEAKPFHTTFLLGGGLSLAGDPAGHISIVSRMYDVDVIEFAYQEGNHKGIFSVGIIDFPSNSQIVL